MATSDPTPKPSTDPSTDSEIPEVPELSGDVLADIVGDKPFPDEEEQTNWPLISFSHVSLWFGDRKVLDNVSFVVNRGETLCILGRSGVGKSVALRILMGFLKPQVGSIRVDGQEINRYTEEEMQSVRRRITMVFQNGALFDSLTVRENVAFPLRERGGQEEDQIQQVVDRLLGLVGADDVPDELPASLSTGRRRAVAIARALAS
ncbi:MAG: ATP-binding cassette domain-containing protein, partial [Terracidiphilus sp.]